MRVCLCSNIFPPDIGGPATFVPRLAAALRALRHEVKVVAVSGGPVPVDYPFPVRRIPRSLPLPRRLARAAWTVWREARDCDVVLANSLELPALAGAFLAGKPLVLKVVGDVAWERARLNYWTADSIDDFQDKRYGPRIEAFKRLRSWTSRRAACVIVPSRYLKSLVEGWGVPGGRIHVLPNALPWDLDGAAAVRARPLNGRFHLLTVGRLVSWKGIDGLLEALARLPERFALDVAGDGPERGRLEAKARSLGVEGRVRFLGALRPEDVRSRLEQSELFILNSSYEGHPHVLLEAMASGVPVVATRAGGTPELVRHGENGWLVPWGDAPALARAIESLAAEDSPRLNLAQEALRGVRSHTMERLAADLSAVLENLLREPS